MRPTASSTTQFPINNPPKAGDIVFCKWPTDNGGTIPHFALVLACGRDPKGKVLMILAYMTSKGAAEAARQGSLTTIAITDPRHIEESRLGTAGRVDFSRTVVMAWSEKNIIEHRNGYIAGRLPKPLGIAACRKLEDLGKRQDIQTRQQTMIIAAMNAAYATKTARKAAA